MGESQQCESTCSEDTCLRVVAKRIQCLAYRFTQWTLIGWKISSLVMCSVNSSKKSHMPNSHPWQFVWCHVMPNPVDHQAESQIVKFRSLVEGRKLQRSVLWSGTRLNCCALACFSDWSVLWFTFLSLGLLFSMRSGLRCHHNWF